MSSGKVEPYLGRRIIGLTFYLGVTTKSERNIKRKEYEAHKDAKQCDVIPQCAVTSQWTGERSRGVT